MLKNIRKSVSFDSYKKKSNGTRFIISYKLKYFQFLENIKKEIFSYIIKCS
jgi:hypothetical protein